MMLSFAQKISKQQYFPPEYMKSSVSEFLSFLFPHTGIVVPPQSVNITINEVAVMNCTAVATVIYWEINYISILAYSDKGFAD